MRSVFDTFLYGFGYDSSTDDYLVVKASYSPISCYNATTRFEFLSLRANAWTDIEAVHLSYKNSSQDIGVGLFLNGAIHWLAFCCDVSMDVVLVFDLTERSFSEIALPVDFSEDDNDFDSCNIIGVLGELLSISAVGWKYSVEIWVMKEYKVQSSWTKTIVVYSENIIFFPVCSTKGGDIVGTYDSVIELGKM